MALWKGAIFATAILWSMEVGAFLVCFPLLPLLLIAPHFYHSCMDLLAGTWFLVPAAFLELFFGIKMRFFGDVIPYDEAALVISNHPTRLDWMFLWSHFLRYARLSTLKIALKDSLRKVPVAGWVMQTFRFLFLSRRWEKDELHMTRLLGQMKEEKYPLLLLLFPEGTDLNPAARLRSEEFATKNGLKPYKYVLHPRTKGTTHTIACLDGAITAIHEFTIGYPDNFPIGEKGLLTGNLPSEIHFYVVRHPIESVPKGEDAQSKWIAERWRLKEQRLEQYYAEKPGNRKFDRPLHADSADFAGTLKLALVCWSIVSLCALYVFLSCEIVRWYVLVGHIVLPIVTALGGIDRIQLDLHARKHRGHHVKHTHTQSHHATVADESKKSR
eukprot:Opistho-2@37255